MSEFDNPVLVSVVIPSYNSSDTLEKAISSVLAQSISGLECIVVDDCSTDSTREVVERISIRDTRVRYLCMPSNSGSPAAPRNMGVQSARGLYIAFLDADDEWRSGKLCKQIEFMEVVGASISCTGYGVFNQQGARIGSFRPLKKTSFDSLLRHNTVGCSTVVLNTKMIGDFSFPLCGHEDYALWLEFARRGHDIYGLNEELGVYRIASGSVSGNKLKVLKFFWNIYRNKEGFSAVRSFFYCVRYAWNVRKKYQ